jgi:hypothetical protein
MAAALAGAKGLRMHTLARIVIAVAALGTVACTGNPDVGDQAYKQGSLGNGGFLFGCADGVACKPFSGDAKKFPTNGVAAGSTFGVRFVASSDQHSDVVVPAIVNFDTDDTTYNGVTVGGLEPFFTEAPTSNGGILASQVGAGTLMARKSDGTILDFISLRVVKAVKLVVYDASQTSPLDVTTLSLAKGGQKQLRVVGQDVGTNNLAGSIQTAWSVDNTAVATVDHTDDGVATFAGVSTGTATATLTGGGLSRTVSVEVK